MAVFFDFLLITVLIGLNGLFVVSEFSLLRVPKTRLQLIIDEGGFGSKRLGQIMSNLNLHIMSLQVGITMTTLGLGVVAYPLFREGVFNAAEFLSIPTQNVIIQVVIIVIVFLAVSSLQSIFGEFGPKLLTIKEIEKVALWISPATIATSKILGPFAQINRYTTVGLLGLLRIKTEKIVYQEVYSESELKMIIAESQKEGKIDATEKRMIDRVFDFTSTPVREILTPRYKITAAPIESKMLDIIELAKQTGHSRFPIYSTNLDNIQGFVHIKDVISAKDQNSGVESIIRNVVSIHEGMQLEKLLEKMQRQRSHVAIVVDEYGTVEGIVTLEDIIEEVFGEIDDEFDEDPNDFIDIEGYPNIVVNANIGLEVFNKAFGITIETEEAVTLAGYLLEHIDQIPAEGTRITINNEEFRIVTMEGNRIAKIEVLQIQGKKPNKQNFIKRNLHTEVIKRS